MTHSVLPQTDGIPLLQHSITPSFRRSPSPLCAFILSPAASPLTLPLPAPHRRQTPSSADRDALPHDTFFVCIQSMRHALESACGKRLRRLNSVELQDHHNILHDKIVGVIIGISPGADDHRPPARLQAGLELEAFKTVPAVQKSGKLGALPAGINGKADNDGISIDYPLIDAGHVVFTRHIPS